MKIEIWSDYVCPFCYIGKRRLEQAIGLFPHRGELEIVYRSFELDPNAKPYTSGTIYDSLAAKFGVSAGEAKAMTANIAEQAKALGLDYRFDTMKPTGTFDAHRLAFFAAGSGKAEELTERLLKAYFTDSEHIGDRDTLVRLAAETGLNAEEARRFLESEEGGAEVRSDEREAGALGVRGVPFFVINRKYAISGAQPTELFLDTLYKAWNEEHPLIFVDGADGEGAGELCEDGSCVIPPRDSGRPS
ncbi:DsbA family oxidoreductase [Paenibacillus ginsengarvi]|uniref:DsbA family oxidoreductase n=1 Tax=Paenibacillus ginsengarvi TaxID=400777 RepID=A0A3B0C6C3_9BACL|nr:DsbA family oxidoreductase [Paenibacillus ginsengarvi]RKN79137.1 DsbA family oxidoreductase [Paenibacillus ginsengarvi]